MDNLNAAEPPLDAATGAVGQRAIEALSVLGNETYSSTLLALWEAYEPVEDANAVSFSASRERLARPYSGQFTYHLGKLAGAFHPEDRPSFHLIRAGLNIIRTVIAGTGTHAPPFDSKEVSESCVRCWAPVEVTYEGEVTKVRCTERGR